MSHKATTWAVAQKGLRPMTRVVLWVIADRASPEGVCFPSRQTIADDAEISVDSVDRHLEVLEQVGLLTIEKRSREDGSPTSSLYRLNYDVELLDKHLARNRKSLAYTRATQPLDAATPQPLEPTGVAAGVRPGVAAGSGSNLSKSSNPSDEPTPQPPPGELGVGAAADSEKEKLEAEADERTRQFLARYPIEPSDRVAGERAFRKLTPDDQAVALRWIGDYVGDCRGKGRKLKSAQAYVRDRVFDGYAATSKLGAATAGGHVFIERGSPEWRAWCEHRGKSDLFAFQDSATKKWGRHEPSRWPPGPPPMRDPAPRRLEVVR